MINTNHRYSFIQFVNTLSHFCRLKLYCTYYCINGYISKITSSKLTVTPGEGFKFRKFRIGVGSYFLFPANCERLRSHQ